MLMEGPPEGALGRPRRGRRRSPGAGLVRLRAGPSRCRSSCRWARGRTTWRRTG
jgi:hypothetical protein